MAIRTLGPVPYLGEKPLVQTPPKTRFRKTVDFIRLVTVSLIPGAIGALLPMYANRLISDVLWTAGTAWTMWTVLNTVCSARTGCMSYSFTGHC